MEQVSFHILQKHQDPVLQNVKEIFKGIKLLIHKLQHDTKGEIRWNVQGNKVTVNKEDTVTPL